MDLFQYNFGHFFFTGLFTYIGALPPSVNILEPRSANIDGGKSFSNVAWFSACVGVVVVGGVTVSAFVSPDVPNKVPKEEQKEYGMSDLFSFCTNSTQNDSPLVGRTG